MNETETPVVPQKIFQVTYINGADNEGFDTYATDTVQGYLGITSDFAAMTDDAGRVVFYMPSHRIMKIVATGDAPQTVVAPSGPVN